METEKNNKLIRLDNEVLKHLESNPFINSFSEWVEERYKEEYMKIETKKIQIEQLKSNMMFNSKTIYPMAQKLLEKKRTGKKTYDDKTFNALFLSMDKAITKEQRYEFFNDAANITNITYNSEY
jgi:hypothetical protein